MRPSGGLGAAILTPSGLDPVAVGQPGPAAQRSCFALCHSTDDRSHARCEIPIGNNLICRSDALIANEHVRSRAKRKDLVFILATE